MEAGLEVDRISKSFQSRVLDAVTFSLGEGTIGALVGPSGAGKTTLLNIISGVYSADQGTVTIAGRLVERGGESPLKLKPIERDVGYVFQDYVLFPHMTVFDNIAFGLRARHLAESSVRERVSSVMKTVGIEELGGRRPSQVSGGQMQRAAVARALVLEPKVLLLDEPLSALDAQTRETVRAELKTIFEDLGTTVVYVTHDLDEAFFMGQKIGIMLAGKLTSFGAKNELFARMPRATAEFLGFNLVRAEPVRVEGTKSLLFLPDWNTEVKMPALGTLGVLPGREVTLAVPPESIEISISEDGQGAQELAVQDIVELKGSVKVVLGNSRSRLVGRLSDLEFHRLGLQKGQRTILSFASGFVIPEDGQSNQSAPPG